MKLGKVIQTALLPCRNYACGLHKIFMRNLAAFISEGKHTGLDTDSLELCSVEILTVASQFLEYHVLPDVHLPAMDAHNLGSGLLGGVRELDLTIQPSRTEQGRIEHIGSVFVERRRLNVMCE